MAQVLDADRSLISSDLVKFNVPEALLRFERGNLEVRKGEIRRLTGLTSDLESISISYVGEIQLDSDSEREVVCEFRLNVEFSWVIIFDKTTDGWSRQIFGFQLLPYWPRVLKGVREVNGGSELVVESISRGSDIVISWLSILRLHEKTAREVLSVGLGPIRSGPQSSLLQRVRADRTNREILYISNPMLPSGMSPCATFRWVPSKVAYQIDQRTPCSGRGIRSIRPIGGGMGHVRK